MAPVISSSLLHPPELRSLVSSTLQNLALRSPPSHPTLPTKTLQPFQRTLASLFRRQITTVTATANPQPIIPTTYSGLNTGPSPPGTVVGIVFGSVAGFLLLLWLVYTCFNLGNLAPASSIVEEETVVRRRSKSRSARRSRSPSSHSRSEVIEVSRTRERSRSRSPAPPPRRESSRRETVIIEETRRPVREEREDDIVEVIEEHSPVRRESRRSSGRQSGFRTVDPDALGGGDRPVRKVSRR